MFSSKTKPRLSLSTQVLIGLVAGLAAGFFFGEMVRPLEVVGNAFINLLMMTVLPYVVVSLVAGLGRLNAAEAKNLALKGGKILLILWALALVTVLVIPLAFPHQEGASFFSATMVEKPSTFDFIGLYIPSNPFSSLANAVVPAVVLFSIALGLALIPVKGKDTVIRLLDSLTEAVMGIAGFIVKLAPIGVFAVTAVAAGTLDFSQLGRLQVYLITYMLVALFLSLWVLPALVTGLTGIGRGRLFAGTRDALVTAFATGNLLIILPMRSQATKDLLPDAKGDQSDQETSSVDVLIPASFNFPNMGKLLSLAFVPFAAWFAGNPLPVQKFPALLGAGFASFFGEVIMALPFLLDLLRLPSDLFQLFVAVDVFTGRFGTVLAAMHVLVFTLLGAYAMSGSLRPRWTLLGRSLAITALAGVAGLAGLRVLFAQTASESYKMNEVLARMQTIRDRMPSIVHREPPPAPPPPREPKPSRLTLIRTRKVIRVGYFPRHLPYSYFNHAGDLVGFDVEMAASLARGLDVMPEFVPVNPSRIAEQLYSGYCDIVMSGLIVTTERAKEMSFSAPYLRGTLGLLVADYRGDDFSSAEAVGELSHLRIGVGNFPYYWRMLRRVLPQAEIVVLETSEEIEATLRSGMKDLDAILMPLEEAAAWSILYPAYNPVKPGDKVVEAPMAYAIPHREAELQEVVDTWIELKAADGTIDELYSYWILGRGAEPTGPRWSVVRNVLGWVD